MSTDRAREAMAGVRRKWFLPAAAAGAAAHDVPLAIGHGATCSQPTTVAHLLSHLDPRPGDRVLDVGSGSGWTTALLATLVGPDGVVVGVELEPALVTFGRANLERAATHGVDVSRARIEHAVPGVLGLPAQGPFERILVSAAARELPAELVAQLAPGGRMVLPVAERLLVVDRDDEATRTRDVGAYRFVPLR